mmetsp:Transcript_22281/g.56887  ORF Transcript_22281/g.56887 Transcript_22281/m.56887 type:complete len:400 (+) Transcript_22281:2023-3222(+)
MRRPAKRRGQAHPVRVPQPHAAALHQGRLRARVARLRGELVPARPHAAGVLLPRHGRPRGPDRHRGQDGRDGVHPATARQVDGGRDRQVRRHRAQRGRRGAAVPLRRGRHGRRRARVAEDQPPRHQAVLLARHLRAQHRLAALRARARAARRPAVARAAPRGRGQARRAAARDATRGVRAAGGGPAGAHAPAHRPVPQGQGGAARRREPLSPDQDGPIDVQARAQPNLDALSDGGHREGARAADAPRDRQGQGPPLGRGAAQRHAQLLRLHPLDARVQARARRAPPLVAGVRLGTGRGAGALPAAPLLRGRGRRLARRAVGGRARHADDLEHLPLRRRLLQERDARRAAAQGDHQRLQTAQDTLADRLPARQAPGGLGGGQGGAGAARAHDAADGDPPH